MGIQTILTDIQNTLSTIAPTIAVILIILSGIIFGIAQTQPAETRGKYISIAIGMFIGGIVIAAISAAAQLIVTTSQGILK